MVVVVVVWFLHCNNKVKSFYVILVNRGVNITQAAWGPNGAVAARSPNGACLGPGLHIGPAARSSTIYKNSPDKFLL